MKKILAVILAASMMLSTAATAFAAGSDTEFGDSGVPSLTPAIGGTVANPKILVNVPTFSNESLIFDIYNQLGKGQQIVSSNLTFINKSVVPVQMKMTGYTAQTSSATPIVSKTKVTDVALDAAKNLLLYFSVSEKETDNNDKLTDNKLVFPAYDEAADAKRVFTDYTNSAVELTGTDGDLGAPVHRGMQGIEKADGTIDAKAFDDAAWLGTRNSITIKFAGNMNTKAVWDTNEKITITPVFEFIPQALELDKEPELPAPLDGLKAGDIPLSIVGVTGMGGKFDAKLIDEANVLKGTTLAPADYTLTIGGAALDTASLTAAITDGGKTVTISKIKKAGATVNDEVVFTIKGTALTNVGSPDISLTFKPVA